MASGTTWRVDASPGVLLWRTANLWQRELRARLRPHGLTQAQFLLLASLDAQPGTVGQAQQDIAAFSGLDVAAVSTGLDQLAAKGYVTQRRGTDARTRQPALTAAGQDLVRTVLPVGAAADATVFAPLAANTGMFRGALQLLLGRRPRLGNR